MSDTLKIALVLLAESHGAKVAATRAERAAAGQTRAADLAACWTAPEIESAFAAAGELERLNRTLAAIAVRQCNGHQTPAGRWDEVAAKRDETKEERTRDKVRAVLAPFGVEPRFGGDPRGSVLKLGTPYSGRSNSFGGPSEGWAL